MALKKYLMNVFDIHNKNKKGKALKRAFVVKLN
jgi:hypothetical protein